MVRDKKEGNFIKPGGKKEHLEEKATERIKRE